MFDCLWIVRCAVHRHAARQGAKALAVLCDLRAAGLRDEFTVCFPRAAVLLHGVRAHPDRHGADEGIPAARAACRRAERCRACKPRENNIPQQYVARYPHAHERHHRLHGAGGGACGRARARAGLSGENFDLGPASSFAHQRRFGHEPHRKRAREDRGKGSPPARRDARSAHDRQREHRVEKYRVFHRCGGCGQRRYPLRQAAAQSGALKSFEQRGQVHEKRRTDHRPHHSEAGLFQRLRDL